MHASGRMRRSSPSATVLAWAALTFSGTVFASASTATAPLILDGARLYVALSFQSGGASPTSLAFFDLGAPSMTVSRTLMQKLAPDRQDSVTFFLGRLPLHVARRAISLDDGLPYSLANGRQVEAVLPGAVLQNDQIVIDYGHLALTLAQPGALQLKGDAIPADINPTTGLIAVHVAIAGRAYAATIDPGSPYTWLQASAVRQWLAEHPDWQRGVGAVGASNMRMADDGLEASGTLLRISELRLGPLLLRDVGALGVGRSKPIGDFIDWYSKKNPEPVVGFLGANVLRDFRLSIDYPHRMTYWERQRDSTAHDLDQVGLTLARRGADYFVSAIVARDSKATVEGVQPGDKLVRAGDLSTHGAVPSAVLAALHGKPGDRRTLVVERNQHQIHIDAAVVEF